MHNIIFLFLISGHNSFAVKWCQLVKMFLILGRIQFPDSMKYTLEKIESARLKFRLLQPEDFDAWLPLCNHPNARRFLGLEHLGTGPKICEKWFEITLDRYKNNKGGMNVLIDKETGKLIGQCGLLVQEVDDMRELEIGYSILPEYWNKGYASEAAITAKETAFKHNYSDSLISIVHIDNIRSEKVARKNGMTIEKTTTFKDMPVNIFRINRL
jgi:RimJ/RimL family protein N-acetyltransferase